MQILNRFHAHNTFALILTNSLTKKLHKDGHEFI